jgi:hypothetical protein
MVNASIMKNESALRAMERTELITIQYDQGHPVSIKPGKPLYEAAFQHLLGSTQCVASMDLRLYKAMIEIEASKIAQLETELKDISIIAQSSLAATDSTTLRKRASFLSAELSKRHDKIDAWSKKMDACQSVLSSPLTASQAAQQRKGWW